MTLERTLHITLAERFQSKYEIDDATGCWNWTAGRFERGYGAFAYGRKRPGYAHRFSYELHCGPVPDGMVVMHKCDNKKCVNPDHLQVGTQKENINDSVNKGRWMTEKRRKFLHSTPQNFRFGQR